MLINKTKWVTLTVAICFAILQALQPFIHAHLDADHPIQHTGFHVGLEHEELISLSNHLTDYSLSAVPHASHTISVASGIKPDTNLPVLIDAVSFVLFCICFALIFKSVSNLFLQSTQVSHKSLKRRLPAARAPPQS
jgi:hypothetical protein